MWGDGSILGKETQTTCLPHCYESFWDTPKNQFQQWKSTKGFWKSLKPGLAMGSNIKNFRGNNKFPFWWTVPFWVPKFVPETTLISHGYPSRLDTHDLGDGSTKTTEKTHGVQSYKIAIRNRSYVYTCISLCLYCSIYLSINLSINLSVILSILLHEASVSKDRSQRSCHPNSGDWKSLI